MKHFAFLSLILLLTSCTGGDSVANLNGKVMAVHDSTMLKMDHIYTTMDGLKDLQKTLQADTVTANISLQTEIEEAIADLTAADDAMMDWMHGYLAPKKDVSDEENIKYLEGQMEGIEKVDQQMDECISKGQKLLSELK